MKLNQCKNCSFIAFFLFICVLVTEKSHRLRFHENSSYQPNNFTSLFLIENCFLYSSWLRCNFRSDLNAHWCTWPPKTWYRRWSPYATNRECQLTIHLHHMGGFNFTQQQFSECLIFWKICFLTKKLKILCSLVKQIWQKLHKLRDRNVKNHWVNYAAKLESH